MAEIIGVPSGLIMRIVGNDIQVFVASKTEGNPYRIGHAEHLFGSGLYCETVVKENAKLLVPNALADKRWKNNPDIKLNMISYLGFPIRWPDRRPFGTICVLDNKANAYSEVYCRLIAQFRDMIEGHLELLYTDAQRQETQMQLTTLVDNLPNGAVYRHVRMPDGHVFFPYISSGIFTLLDIPAAEIIENASALRQTIHEEDLHRVMEAEERSRLTGGMFECQFRHRARNGRIVWVHCRSTPRREPDGTTIWDGVIVGVPPKY